MTPVGQDHIVMCPQYWLKVLFNPLYYNYTPCIVGSRNPKEPEIIEAVNETSTSVTVSWRVESVSYTPETYTVHYGTSESDQIERSQTVSGPTQLQEILDLNRAEYRVTLTDLNPYTGYYYYINATNTEGSSSSTLEYLITDEDGMLLVMSLHLHFCFSS